MTTDSMSEDLLVWMTKFLEFEISNEQGDWQLDVRVSRFPGGRTSIPISQAEAQYLCDLLTRE